MQESKKCPKCGSQLELGDLVSYGDVRLMKSGDLRGDKVVSFYCKNCGYMELYNQKYLKT